MRAFISVLAVAAIAGCASSGVIPTDQGKYMITKNSGGGMFVSGESVKADLYVEANKFCADKGQVVETISAVGKNAIPFARTSSAAIEFRCVKPQ